MQELHHVSSELSNMNSTLRAQLDRLVAETSARQVCTAFILFAMILLVITD